MRPRLHLRTSGPKVRPGQPGPVRRLVRPFESQAAAEAWRDKHAVDAADAQIEVVPFARRLNVPLTAWRDCSYSIKATAWRLDAQARPRFDRSPRGRSAPKPSGDLSRPSRTSAPRARLARLCPPRGLVLPVRRREMPLETRLGKRHTGLEGAVACVERTTLLEVEEVAHPRGLKIDAVPLS